VFSIYCHKIFFIIFYIIYVIIFRISLISIPYLIIWIFLGNYLIFNLFLSILLSSFEDINDEDDFDSIYNNIPKAFNKFILPDGEQEYNLKEEQSIRN